MGNNVYIKCTQMENIAKVSQPLWYMYVILYIVRRVEKFTNVIPPPHKQDTMRVFNIRRVIDIAGWSSIHSLRFTYRMVPSSY